MPRQDGTGPVWGSGPGAGWGKGNCDCASVGRYGIRNRVHYTKEEKLNMLGQEEITLKEQLADLQAAKEELKK